MTDDPDTRTRLYSLLSQSCQGHCLQLLSGQEHKVEGEVMQSDARLLRKDGERDSGGGAPEQRKQWKVGNINREMDINIPGAIAEVLPL
jgi:hypothetical protein